MTRDREARWYDLVYLLPAVAVGGAALVNSYLDSRLEREKQETHREAQERMLPEKQLKRILKRKQGGNQGRHESSVSQLEREVEKEGRSGEAYRDFEKRGVGKEGRNEAYKLLEDFIGKPYGPKYPDGEDKGKEMYDCVSLIYAYAEKQGYELSGSRGDQIYARHTEPVTTLSPENHTLEGINSGDLIFIGHPYEEGEGGISAYHLGIVGKVKYENGEPVDATMVHASGHYWNGREDYEGEVKEVDLLDYLERFEDNSRRNHMFIGRLRE